MVSTPSYDAWLGLAAEEYRRLDRLLGELMPEEWGAGTVCEGWDVRAMVAHLVGAAEATASVRELVRQAVRSRGLPGADLVDRMNALQVRERAARAPDDLVADLAAAGRRGLAARRRLPGPVRALRLPFGPPLGVRRVDYLFGRIYTRDAWMHRLDVCAATGREPELTKEHDGVLVADVVSEWSAGLEDLDLTLTGPAGGRWRAGGATVPLVLDAVELARLAAGRGTASGPLARTVPF